MKKWIFFILFSFSLAIGWSQSINGAVRESTITSSFDNLTIQTYSVQGQLKVEELFEYLRLIALNDNSSELNNQLQATIEQLFIDEPIRLEGVDSKTTLYTAKQWTNDWKNSSVEVEKIQLIESQLKTNHWIYSYQLTYKVNGNQKSKKMEVQVFFQPQSKSFGKTQKEVWDMRLGSIHIR